MTRTHARTNSPAVISGMSLESFRTQHGKVFLFGYKEHPLWFYVLLRLTTKFEIFTWFAHRIRLLTFDAEGITVYTALPKIRLINNIHTLRFGKRSLFFPWSEVQDFTIFRNQDLRDFVFRSMFVRFAKINLTHQGKRHEFEIPNAEFCRFNEENYLHLIENQFFRNAPVEVK